jgi:hypothetical protein
VSRAATAGLIAVALMLAGASTSASAAEACVVSGHAVAGVAHSRVVSVGALVIVYRTRGPRADDFWACGRRSHRLVLIGRDDSYQSEEEEHGPTTALFDFRVAGSWLIATHATGDEEFAGCTKYALSACKSPLDTLVVADVARGLRGQLARIETNPTDASGKGSLVSWSRTLLSPQGAVAWLQHSAPEAGAPPSASQPPSSALFGCLLRIASGAVVCTAHLLAQGTIPPASLALSARTLSWSAGGQAGSALIQG